MATDTGTSVPRLVGDLCTLLMLIVLAIAPTEPDWALRQGAVVAGVVILLSIGQQAVSRADVLAVAYAALAYLSVSWSADADVSFLGAYNAVACAALFVAARLTIRSARQLRWLSWAFVLGCWFGLYRLISSGAKLRWAYDASAERIGIEGLNYNALAYALATGAVIAAVVWVAKPKPRSVATHTLLLSSWIMLYAGIILSGTRGALMGVLGLGAWFWAIRRFGKPAFRLLLWTFAVSHALAATGLADNALRGLLASEGRDAGDLSGRLVLWPVARAVFLEQPFFGAGVDALQVSRSNPFGTAAHNMVLDVVTGVGLIGLVLFVWTFVSALGEARTRISTTHQLLVGGYLITILPISMTGFWTEAPAFWISLALVSRIHVLAPPGSVDSGAETAAFPVRR